LQAAQKDLRAKVGLVNQMILRTLFDLTLEQAISIWQANNELYLIELDSESPPRLWKLITLANLGDL
jgi:hypothetical protein